MTFGIIRLSEKNRRLLTRVLIMLNIFQLLLGLGLLTIGCYILLVFADHIHKTNRKHSVILSFYIISVGFTTIFLAIISIRVMYNFSQKPLPTSINHFHNTWVLFTVMSIILVFGFQFALDEIFEHLLHVISDTFLQGISRYISDQSWMDTFDYLQINFQCCGITNYTDWYKTSWISLSDLPQAIVSSINRPDGRFLFPLTPNSCCKLKDNEKNNSCMVNVTTKIMNYNFQQLRDTEVYSEGCLIKLIAELSRTNTIASTIATCIILTLIAIIVGGHYLFTSERNSLLMGNPHGTAPGWLFGRGDCGYTHGKPLISNEQLNGMINKNKITNLKKNKEIEYQLQKRKTDIGKENKLVKHNIKVNNLRKNKIKNKFTQLRVKTSIHYKGELNGILKHHNTSAAKEHKNKIKETDGKELKERDNSSNGGSDWTNSNLNKKTMFLEITDNNTFKNNLKVNEKKIICREYDSTILHDKDSNNTSLEQHYKVQKSKQITAQAKSEENNSSTDEQDNVDLSEILHSLQMF